MESDNHLQCQHGFWAYNHHMDLCHVEHHQAYTVSAVQKYRTMVNKGMN